MFSFLYLFRETLWKRQKEWHMYAPGLEGCGSNNGQASIWLWIRWLLIARDMKRITRALDVSFCFASQDLGIDGKD